MTKPKDVTPICCNEEARWVDNGPRLQYFYCDKCKKEVLAPVLVEEAPKKDDPWWSWSTTSTIAYPDPMITTYPGGTKS